MPEEIVLIVHPGLLKWVVKGNLPLLVAVFDDVYPGMLCFLCSPPCFLLGVPMVLFHAQFPTSASKAKWKIPSEFRAAVVQMGAAAVNKDDTVWANRQQQSRLHSPRSYYQIVVCFPRKKEWLLGATTRLWCAAIEKSISDPGVS